MFLFKPFRTAENVAATASAPVIIDVNKIGVLDQTTRPEAADMTPESNDERRGLFRLFAFSNLKNTDNSLNHKAAGSSGPALDKVITMKDDLDFVDIQVRKLSYAEAAALNPKQKVQYRVGRSAKGSVDNNREPLVVNDSELGASITDVELLEHQTRNSKYKVSYQDLLDQQAESIVNEEVACRDFEPAIYETDETELNYNLKKLVPKKKLRKMKKLHKK